MLQPTRMKGFRRSSSVVFAAENEPKRGQGGVERVRRRGHPGRCPLKVNWPRAGSRDLVVEDGESANPILAGRRSGGQKEEGDEAKRETANLQRRDHQQAPAPSLTNPTPQHPPTLARCSREGRREAAGEGETDKPLFCAASSKRLLISG